MMMINLANGLTRPIQLAASLGISRQAVQLGLADLEKEGRRDQGIEQDGREEAEASSPAT